MGLIEELEDIFKDLDGYMEDSEFCIECLRDKKTYCEKYMDRKLCKKRNEVK